MRELEMQQEISEYEIVKHLVENDEISGAALGIAKHYLDEDAEPLSARQEAVFDRQIRDKYFAMECPRCHAPLPTSELVYVLAEGDGLCSWCRHMKGKYYSENE